MKTKNEVKQPTSATSYTPELLEAAKELEKYLAICFQEKQGGNGGMINGLIKLRAVIAKAEGK